MKDSLRTYHSCLRAGAWVVGVCFLVTPFAASADTASDLRAQIATLTQQIIALEALVSARATASGVSANVNAVVVSAKPCVTLTRTFGLGAKDFGSGGEIAKLQDFLSSVGALAKNSTTGYFGPSTGQALQKWQASHGIMATGTPLVGPKTRATMACAPSLKTATAVTGVTIDPMSLVVFSNASFSITGSVAGDASKAHGFSVFVVGQNYASSTEWAFVNDLLATTSPYTVLSSTSTLHAQSCANCGGSWASAFSGIATEGHYLVLVYDSTHRLATMGKLFIVSPAATSTATSVSVMQ